MADPAAPYPDLAPYWPWALVDLDGRVVDRYYDRRGADRDRTKHPAGTTVVYLPDLEEPR